MKLLNQFLAIFLIVTALLIFVAWRVLHSERLASFITEELNRKVLAEYQIDFDFEKMDFGLFPPSTSFYNVKLEHEDKAKKLAVSLSLKKVRLKYPWFSLLSYKFRLEEILLENGQVQVSDKSESTLTKDQIKEKITTSLDKVSELKKVASVFEVDSIGVIYNEYALNLKKGRLDLRPYNHLTLEVEDLSYESFLQVGVVIDAEWKKSDEVKLRLSMHKEDAFFEMKGATNLRQFTHKGGTFSLYCPLKLFEKFGLKDFASATGAVNLSGEILGTIESPEARGVFLAEKVSSPYFDAVKVEGGFRYAEKEFYTTAVSILGQKGKIGIDDLKINLMQLKDSLKQPLVLQLENFALEELLKAVPELKDLTGNYTGKVEVQLQNNDIVFTLKTGGYVSDVIYWSRPTKIISTPKLKFQDSIISFNYKTYDLVLDLQTRFGESSLNLIGEIKDGNINFQTTKSNVNLKDLGAIFETPWGGKGPINFKVISNDKDTKMVYQLDVDDFTIDQSFLGNIRGELVLDFNASKLFMNKIAGQIKSSKYKMQGELDYKEDLILSLDLKLDDFIFKDSSLLFEKYLPSAVAYHLDEVDAKYSGRLDFKAKLKDFSNLTSHFNLQGKSLGYRFEHFDDWILKGTTENGRYDVDKFQLKKKKTQIYATLLFDKNTEELEVDFSIADFKLTESELYQSMGLGLDGLFTANFHTHGKLSALEVGGDFVLQKATLLDKKIPDSYFKITGKEKRFKLQLDVADQINMKSFLNFNGNETSSVDLEVKVPDLSILFSFLSGEEDVRSGYTGQLFAKMNASMNLSNPKSLDLIAEVDDFSITTPIIYLKHIPGKNVLRIKNGVVTEGELSFRGKKAQADIKAQGSLEKQLSLMTTASIDASILEPVSRSIESLTGPIALTGKYVWRANGENDYYFLTTLTDGVAKIKGLFNTIDNIDASIRFEKNTIFLQGLVGQLGSGSVKCKGGLEFSLPFPQANFNYEIDNAKLELNQKTAVTISGRGTLEGRGPPYLLHGDLNIESGKSTLELNEFSASKRVKIGNIDPLLPTIRSDERSNYLQLDIPIKTVKPLIFKNSMIDLQLETSGLLTGSAAGPIYDGVITIIPNSSKFYFKGQEFQIADGEIRFSRDNNRDPSFSITGESKIKDYQVFIKVFGRLSSLQVRMESIPYLPQEEILSLVALGVTNEMSGNLTDEERQSLASMSIGNLLLDQLNVTSGITSTLGMKLSIQPDLDNDPSSQLAGRVSSDSAQSKNRSNTKIKVQKKIGQKTNLSVSSSVGNVGGQKQEMNLDYNVNKHLSLEGVYEKKTLDENSGEAPESMGADMKFRWSF